MRRRIRSGLRSMIARGLYHRSFPYPLEDDARLVVISPHPDDSTLGCGGLMLLKRLEGASVRIVYLTDGAGSHPGHPRLSPPALTQLRRAEEQGAAAQLGIDQSQLAFLDEPDGTLNHLSPAGRAAVIERIAAALRIDPPDQVFLPYRADGSSEHEAGFGLVAAALAAAGLKPRMIEYPVWAWWAPLRLVQPLLRADKVWRLDHSGYQPVKAAAVAVYASQILPTPPWPQAVLSPEFVAAFGSSREYFFESDPP